MAIGLLYGCQVFQFAGDKETTGAMTGEILRLSARYGLPAYEGYAAIIHAWAVDEDERAEAILQVLSAMGCRLFLSYYGSLVGDNAIERGRFAEAIVRIDGCLAHCRALAEHAYEPELLLRRGYCELQLDATSATGREFLERAARQARQQSMPRTEARALLAQLHSSGSALSLRTRLDEVVAEHAGLEALITTTQDGFLR
jgi:hypothetical protein